MRMMITGEFVDSLGSTGSTVYIATLALGHIASGHLPLQSLPSLDLHWSRQMRRMARHRAIHTVSSSEQLPPAMSWAMAHRDNK